ncbi:MAG: phospho-sugar mutase, partial [Eggerthellaceae bacterium]|nr:phospho-sugar mutase [Eggerthellaceae bacterium]
HNPAEYNGYKTYDDSGCQITTETAKAISSEISNIDLFTGPKHCDINQALEEGKIEVLGKDMYLEFCDAVLCNGLQGFFEEISNIDLGEEDLSVVYTPLNGAGLFCAEEIFKRLKLNKVDLVQSQVEPDGNFPTCTYPNPEMKEALAEGLKLAREKDADILVATDPDADRMGVAIKEGGDYSILFGNEIGMLMLDYLISMHKKHCNDITKKLVDTSIVSSPIIEDMAQDLGFELRLTLTGFKFIGEQVNMLVEENRESDFLFGFEESYGYCSGTHMRDKDALNAIALFIALARTLKAEGISVSEQLDKIYKRYGYYVIKISSYFYPGAKGAACMQEIMDGLQNQPLTEIAGLKVEGFKDYNKAVQMTIINPSCASQTLPAANVLEFQLEGGNKVIVRPSGTEPKIKSYVFAKKAIKSEAQELCDKLNGFIVKLMS